METMKVLNPDVEYGIVLEGGGARGAYQVGAWKALREHGFKIKGVVGTSVGALNGVLMATDEFEKAYDLWKNLKYSQVINIDEEIVNNLKDFSLSNIDFNLLRGMVKKFWVNNGMDITPLKEMIAKVVDEDLLRNSECEYGLVTVSVTDMKPVTLFVKDMEKGLLHDFLLASSYLPVFKREKLHGKFYLDGGFYDNVPKKMLIDKGYKDIIVIRIHGIGKTKHTKLPKDVNMTVIETKEDLGGILEFNQQTIEENLKMGYYDALRHIKGLQGFKYYIDTKITEKFAIKRLLHLRKSTREKLIKIWGKPKLCFERNFFEYIIPNLAKTLGVKEHWSYSDILLYFYEYMADQSGIERYKIYTFEALEEEVHEINECNLNGLILQFIKKYDKSPSTILSTILD